MKTGPLAGLKVIELAGLAAAPFACTVLADLGAEVIKVDRVTPSTDALAAVPNDPLSRGRRSIGVDIKTPEGVELVLKLVETADVFIEGFRPGVTERMGLGPNEVHARNPRVIYGRMTGWGQQGPLAKDAGHDINYIGLSGVLEPIGRSRERPVPPLNLLGDFAGGGLLLAMGVLAAVYERESSGRGQVIDAAMVDGSALLSLGLHGLHASGGWNGSRGENLLDGGAPFYDTYETADGKYVAVGALEPKFWAELISILGLTEILGPHQVISHWDRREWPRIREALTTAISAKTRDELVALARGTDACLTPVLSPWEAAEHTHNSARENFVKIAGTVQPAPAPKFSRTPSKTPEAPHAIASDTSLVLKELGWEEAAIVELRARGIIY
jgi:alpha-methylacyl-CoA racemase